MTYMRGFVTLLAVCTLLWPAEHALAQGVTTGAITGIVTNDPAGAGRRRQRDCDPRTIRHHVRGRDTSGRTILDSRHEGRRAVQRHRRVRRRRGHGVRSQKRRTTSRSTSAWRQTWRSPCRPLRCRKTITVTAQVDPVFSSSRTGAATSVSRADIAMLPTISGNISDLTRLTPQASGDSFARPGQPAEQHDRRRVLLQQPVRTRSGPAGRQNRRRADLVGVHRAGAGQRRAL